MTDIHAPDDSRLADALAAWLPAQRWFSAKNRRITAVRIVQRVGLVSEPGFAAEHVVIAVSLDDGVALTYQVPLGFRTPPAERFAAGALPGLDVVAYDGTRDPAVTARYLAALVDEEVVGAVQFHAVAAVDSSLPGRALGAEQSNTSVVFGDSLLFKFFRQLTVGINPDVELHRALGDAGCEYVAPLVGWSETVLSVDATSHGEATTLAMAQQFVPGATDGWVLALSYVRDSFADFTAEASALGAAVAGVHADLARELGTERRALGVDTMLANLDAAVAVVPPLAAFRAAVASAYEEAAGLVEVQRVHGDLHLGQVLRVPEHWLLIDFEGEPIKSIAERRTPDSTLRDVAGMLRSFDYAGGQAGADSPGAAAWVSRNVAAFCDGYTRVAGRDPRAQSALLRAFELDKAVYEAAYEARHRPTWLPLPLRAIERLVG
ncbi:MAG TPA: hypothetical protein VIW24_14100 [Aldersonia sp.]